jgi:Secretion system C-terminal sorting domain
MLRTLLLISIFSLTASNISSAQTVRACMDTSANHPNSVNFWLRADLTTPFDTCASSLQFSIAIPDTFSGTKPTTFTVDSSAWAGSTWIVNAPYLEAGFWHYDILTAYTPCMNYTANVDYFAMRVSPVGGTATPYNYYLMCLPDGGTTTGGALFYHFGAWLSDGANLFFDRPGTTSVNQLSYDITGGMPGVAPSWSKILNSVALPINNIALQAQWANTADAQLNWQLQNDEASIGSYSIQRSIDGIKFENIYTSNNKITDFTDLAIKYNTNSNNIFYRIAATKKTGEYYLSNTVSLQKNTTNEVYIFPVPATTFLNINLGNNSAVIYLYSNTGQLLQTENSVGAIHQLDINSLANGVYTVKVVGANGWVSAHRFSKVGK